MVYPCEEKIDRYPTMKSLFNQVRPINRFGGRSRKALREPTKTDVYLKTFIKPVYLTK
jgi:hypothetical protein